MSAEASNQNGGLIDQDEDYDKPLRARPWEQEHTNETVREIENFSVKPRPLIKMQFIKKRKEFGKNQKLVEIDGNEKMQEIKQTADPFNSQKNLVIDIGLQGSNRYQNTAVQTQWNRKINKTITVEDDIKRLQIPDDNQDLIRFIDNVQMEIESALQSNETIDIYQNDFDIMANEEMNFGNDSELSTQIKEWKNFTYPTKGFRTTCIQFQPNTNNYKTKLIAASFIQNLTFDDRIPHSYRSHKNFIVLWDYEDQHSIDPVMLLISPLEIMTFQFNPKDPMQVIAGAINGQIIMWDLKQSDKFQGLNQQKNKNKQNKEKGEAIEVQPLLMSFLQEPSNINAASSGSSADVLKKNVCSHKNPVLSLQWLPQGISLDKKSISSINSQSANEIPHQFATISCDGQILIWDNKFLDNKQKPLTDFTNFAWKAMFGIQLYRPQGGGQMGGAHIAFRKNQTTATLTGASDEGEVFFLDWQAKTNEEGEKQDMIQQFWQYQRNYRPAVGLDVSPFFDDIILSLHDFNFCVWKHGIEQPIFESNIVKGSQITCGCFSPSRPGVIMIGRSDGVLDIWDFLDQSHKETMQYQAGQKMLTCMRFNEQQINNLCIGNIDGNLTIIEIPSTLARKLGDEERTMREFWKREEQKVHYFQQRFDFREEAYKKEKAMQEKLLQQSDSHNKKEDENPENDEEKAEEEYQEFAQKYISEQILKETPVEPEESNQKDKSKKK